MIENNDHLYRKITSSSNFGIVLGILMIISGIVLGTLSIISGGRLRTVRKHIID